MKSVLCAIAVSVICVCIVTSSYAATAQELFKKGQEAYQSGDYEQAIKFYEEAIELNPDFAEAYNGLGMVHRATNSNLSTILWYFKMAVEIDPNYAEACDSLGRVYYTIGNFDRAEEYEKRALSINPNMSSAHYALAWIYLLGKSQPEKAVFYFNKILERRQIPFAYYGLGLAYLMSNQRAPVLEIITNLRSMDNDKLATQLEDMLRTSDFYMPRETIPLVSIRPPPELQEGIVVPSRPAEKKITGDESQPIDLGGQAMKVRLKGKLIDLKELDNAKSRQQDAASN